MVGNLCAAGAKGPSIAHQIGITVDTLYIRCQEDNGQLFSEFSRSHHDRGDDILKVKQFDMAQNGNERLLIWLGKQRLGQRDKMEHTGADGESIPVVNIQVMPPSNGGAGK